MDITASEVIGELRKAARLYEVFKRAEEMARVLVDLEKKQKDLETKIAILKVDEENVDKAIDEKVARTNAQLADTLEKVKAAEAQVVNAEKRAMDIVSKAKEEAASVMKQTKVEFDALKHSMKSAKDAELVALQKAKEARDRLDAVMFEVESKKRELLKAFS